MESLGNQKTTGRVIRVGNRSKVARLQAWDVPCTEADARDFIRGLDGAWPGRPGTWFQFAVCSAASGELLGDVGLRTTTDDPPHAELGFTLAAAHQGQGHAAEALGEILPYVREQLGIVRVFAITAAENAPARRLLERLGFGLLRRLDDGTCVYDDTI